MRPERAAEAFVGLLMLIDQFADLGDKSPDYVRLLGMDEFPEGGMLSLRGLRVDGELAEGTLTLSPP